MTSTSITTVGGLVVVTQVIPQDDNHIQLQTAATSPQAPPPATKAPPTHPAKMDDMAAAFLRGEPLGLGVVQIFIGLLCILFSLTAVYSPTLIGHAPLCLAVTFVVSGSLAVAAARRTSVRLVWASLVWHLISVVFGLAGVAYLCWLLAAGPPSERFCGSHTLGGFMSTDEQKTTCINKMWMLNVSVYGLLGLLLVLLVLQVCVAVTVCVFSGKAIRRRGRHVPIMVDVHNGSALLSGAASELGSDVALLDSDG
ncbi:membrane-spanning 4-domains subfamily A member 4A [Enoplosus armatus]|uniref:membrane-spanning 4-domains subfamily A member 4A n=1 Tax=Enoplosus armatus TaxID=215367 RepID=UPI0039910395